ncbi:MAG: hypothetical protein R3C30_12285 [Hyphomonadaceae bacterium]
MAFTIIVAIAPWLLALFANFSMWRRTLMRFLVLATPLALISAFFILLTKLYPDNQDVFGWMFAFAYLITACILFVVGAADFAQSFSAQREAKRLSFRGEVSKAKKAFLRLRGFPPED